MSNLYENGSIFLEVRSKINAVAGFLKIAETDVLITAGATISIPIVTLTKNLLGTAQITKVQLLHATTGIIHELTLTAGMFSADVALTIASYTFPDDVPVGSGIYLKLEDLLAYIYTTL